MKTLAIATVSGLLLVGLVSFAEDDRKEMAATPESTVKILFVGDSLTYWNKGVFYHIEQLASSANPPLIIEADEVVISTSSLETMWKRSGAREMIGKGVYDVVVLQESIIFTNVDAFKEFVRKFDEEIKEAGAETVLFMTWPCGFSWSRMEAFVHAHHDIAKELGADVAPFGLAWKHAVEERSDLDMCDPDGVHPGIYATYLATNVVYATVFEESPIGLAYQPSKDQHWRGSVTKEEAAFLQRIAWETVKEYQARQ